MPRSYVALDLETTGLAPDRDAITEIGAVRFDLDGGSETFSTLVDPGQPIPYRIQRLTGIGDNDVAGAPQFAEIAADLKAFIGGDPVVGQNIRFDLGFLEKQRLRPPPLALINSSSALTRSASFNGDREVTGAGRKAGVGVFRRGR